MSKNSSSVPEAKEALNRFKYEVASEIGVPLKQGYNGDLTSFQNGSVGGNMVNNIVYEQRKREYSRMNGMVNIEPMKVIYTYTATFA